MVQADHAHRAPGHVARKLPLSGEQLRWALGLGTLALLVRLPFLFGHHIAARRDAPYFLDVLARGIHDDFYFPNHYWTPGYPAFEALLIAVPGRAEDAIAVTQHLLGVAVVVGMLLAAWRWFGKPAAILAALLAASTPVLVVLEHTLLPDFLFGVLVLAGGVTLAEAVRRQPPDWRLLVLAGVLFGACAWVKPIGQALLIAPPLALAVATRSLRPVLRGSAITTVALIVVIAPWVARNAAKHDFPAMSIQGGQTLFIRVYELDETPLPTDSADGRFAQRVQDRIDRGQEDDRLHFAIVRDLMARGVSDHDAILKEQRLALTGVRRHPGSYVVKTWPRVWGIAHDIRKFEDRQRLLDDLERTDPPFPTRLTAGLWDGAKVLNEAWWFASLFTLAGLLLLVTGPAERRSAAAALWSVWLSVALGTALFMPDEGRPAWRYSIALAPLTWILGSAGIATIAGWTWSALRRRVRSPGRQAAGPPCGGPAP